MFIRLCINAQEGSDINLRYHLSNKVPHELVLEKVTPFLSNSGLQVDLLIDGDDYVNVGRVNVDEIYNTWFAIWADFDNDWRFRWL